MIRYVTRYNFESRKWEYGYHMGAVFVVVAKYPNMEYAA
jgi:hypothetical protein